MKTFIPGLKKILRKHNLFLFILLMPAFVSAQIVVSNEVTMNVVLKPPYSANYSTYENLANHAIITLVGGERDMDLVLYGTLTNTQRRGFSISTRTNYTGGQFKLLAHQTKVMVADVPSMVFLGRNNVEHGVIQDEEWMQILKTGQLPEGTYELCVQAFTASAMAGPVKVGSACTNFSITQAQAPVITSPADGQELNSMIANTVFAWTPPVGNIMGANIVYDLYVVKVPQGQSPNDAVNAAVNFKANNPVIKNNLTSNQYVTQPYDLAIDTNALYAVQVIARDVNKLVGFVNNGKSQVVTFRKGKTVSSKITTTVKIEKGDKDEKKLKIFPVENDDPVPLGQVNGKLFYKFADDNDISNFTANINDANKNISGKPVLQSAIPNNGNLNVQKNQANTGDKKNQTGFYSDGNDDLVYNKPEGFTTGGYGKPLADQYVSLVITYIFSGSYDGGAVTGVPLSELGEGKIKFELPDNGKVLATTKTGPDGSFSFNFVNSEKTLGLLDEDFSKASGYSDVYSHNVKGKLFKVLRVRVNSFRYCSPDVNIKLSPWTGINLGNLVSFVNSYNLKVKVVTTLKSGVDMAYGLGAPLPGITTAVSRKDLFLVGPKDEGEPETKGNLNVLSVHETGKDGFVIFKRLLKHNANAKTDRYHIDCIPDKKKGDFIFADKNGKYVDFKGKIQAKSGNLGFYENKYLWNHQLVIPTLEDEIILLPESPRIAGKLQDADNPAAKAFSNGKVLMVEETTKEFYNDPSKIFKWAYADSMGRYAFDDLEVKINVALDYKVVAPTRTLHSLVNGYKNATLPGSGSYPPLKWGEQKVNQDFFLTPDGELRGYVEDEKGNAIEADVDIDGYVMTKTQPGFSKQSFSANAPSGKRKITIYPVNKAYPITDTVINIKQNKTSDLIKFVVIRSQKRLQFKVAEYPAKAIQGAKVILDIAGQKISQTSNKDGVVSFLFDNNSSTFSFTIKAPDNTDYEEGYLTISGVKNTQETKDYGTVFLKKAATISGKVTEGHSDVPVAGAKVYIETGGGKSIEATTGKDGKYVLKGIPKTLIAVTVWATKPGEVPNYLSTSKKINTVGGTIELNFSLSRDKELLIENIFGFDVDIQSRAKQSDGSWLVSGNLINLPENDNFTTAEKEQYIPFYNLKVILSGQTKQNVPIGIPTGKSMTTDLASVKMMLHKKFSVVQTPVSEDRLQIVANDKEAGLMGKIGVLKSSFTFTDSYINFNTTGKSSDYAVFLTEKPGSSNTNLRSLIASTVAPEKIQTGNSQIKINTPGISINKVPKQRYGIGYANGETLLYNLLGFEAVNVANDSWIEDNTLNLKTVVHLQGLPGMSPSVVNLEIGNVIIHPDKMEPLDGNKPIKFNLEKWQFTGNDWHINQTINAFQISKGTIKTGSIDVPVSDVSLKPGSLSIGSYNISSVTLGGIIPVQVTAANPVFGYNQSIGKDQKAHYELRLIGSEGNPGVVIKSLPGMKPGDEMKFENFSLISNGESIIQPGSQSNSLTFYNVMKVKPISFISGDGYVNMSGGIDLGIPQLQETSGIIQFTKEGNGIKFKLYPLNVSLNGPGHVDFLANLQFNDNPQVLAENKFTAMGTIKDKEGINLKALLVKTPTESWVEINPKGQKMSLGGSNTSLANIEGAMKADMAAGVWDNLVFSGEMKGFNGMQGDLRKTFKVTGSINAENEKIEVKNIPSGFGNIGLTYDIANSRFVGSLEIDQKIGPMALTGSAELLIDPGGWYFLAGGMVQSPGMGKFAAGLLIGNYSGSAPNVTPKLLQYAYNKNVPKGFEKGVNGFLFVGQKDIPGLNVPPTELSLFAVTVKFGVTAGLDARLWMDFSGDGTELGIGIMAFVNANISVDAITCTSLSAEAKAEIGITGTYQTNTGLFAIAGCASFKLSASGSQGIPPVPYPCLDGFCCPPAISIGGTYSVRVDLLMDSNKNMDAGIKFDATCSGQ